MFLSICACFLDLSASPVQPVSCTSVEIPSYRERIGGHWYVMTPVKPKHKQTWTLCIGKLSPTSAEVKGVIWERYIWISLQPQHSSLYFLLSLRGSLSKSLKKWVSLSKWMFYELRAAGGNRLSALFPAALRSISQHCSTMLLPFQEIECLTLHAFSCKLSLSLCCLSPGSCWLLDIKKYGTLQMEAASRPLLPAP